ncbi:MAG TPA: pyridoxamine 5'-phosphate oxidase [Acidimicrobiales bacterium]|nr:pyridoxamine 5'-phosphate oxidase [Acidimicrobiales bacterium]
MSGPGPDHARPLLEAEAAADPVTQFTRWFDEAALVSPMPEALAVATVGADGRPSVRMVLLKGWDDSGFVFYTNYASRKGIELAADPHAALLAHWLALGRQVRIEGPAHRVPAAESDAYWATRPRGSQLSAVASDQSRPVADRAELEEAVAALEAELGGRPVPRPPWWGGYRVVPEAVEFWQNRSDRLHDRLVYLGERDRWRVERLAP